MSHRDYSFTVTRKEVQMNELKQRDINPFGLRMQPGLRKWLDEKAKQEDRSLNWLVCKILKEAMEKDGQSNCA